MKKNWIIWNRETKSIQDFGLEFEMTERASTLNRIYQSDAYVAREYIE